MSILNSGDTIGIIACSNGLGNDFKPSLIKLINLLEGFNLKVKVSPFIFRKTSIFNGSDLEKASSLEEMFTDISIKAIFDISGGDLSNGLLNHLNFTLIKNNPKPFFGYSDLSVLINSLYSQSKIPTYYYQLRNLLYNDSENQINYFKNSILGNSNDLFNLSKEWIQGDSMNGVVVGGNLRCTLKLAGTKYLPNFANKVLFLESLGGDIAKVYTAFNQYKQIGAFNNLNGIILGEFTEMENNNYEPTVVELLLKVLDNPNIPVIKTKDLGHSKSAKAIPIGKSINL